ncbi:hypothetical protein HDU96_008782 [Phlyctochytrium bullatum]|nr:hypothetical protein HDU96_008782 [Phlyctochytrium bullatum]
MSSETSRADHQKPHDPSSRISSNSTSSQEGSLKQELSAAELGGAKGIRHTKWTKLDVLVVFIGIFFVQLSSNLEESMTVTAGFNILSYFNALSYQVYLASIPYIIIAALKPAFAKMSDTFGRKETVVVSICITFIAYILLFISDSFATLFAGQMIQAAGTTAFFVVANILIADIVPLLLRGSVSAYLNIPLLFNGFLAPWAAGKLLQGDFRWIFRVGGILWAVFVGITFYGLYRAEARWKHDNKGSSATTEPTLSIADKIKNAMTSETLFRTCSELDVIGLFLITGGTVFILVPLNLTNTFSGGWNSPIVISLLVLGAGLMVAFYFYEAKVAKYPVVPVRLLKNRTVLGALIVTTSIYMAANAAVYWFNPYLQVTKFVSVDVAGYIQYGYSGGFAVGTIIAGLGMQWTKIYRIWMWVGLLGFSLSMGLLINAKGQSTTELELGLVQALAGVSAGVSSMAASIGLQASLDHADLAIGVTMKDFVVFYGGALGVAFGGALWNRVLPDILRRRVAEDPTLVLDVDMIVSNLFYITYLGPREILTVQEGYVETQRYASILGLCLSTVGIFGALLMKSVDLSKVPQNAVDIVGYGGAGSNTKANDTESDP